MRKKTKKLVLAKETLVKLEGLGRVRGGEQLTATDCLSACYGFDCPNEFGSERNC